MSCCSIYPAQILYVCLCTHACIHTPKDCCLLTTRVVQLLPLSILPAPASLSSFFLEFLFNFCWIHPLGPPYFVVWFFYLPWYCPPVSLYLPSVYHSETHSSWFPQSYLLVWYGSLLKCLFALSFLFFFQFPFSLFNESKHTYFIFLLTH